MRSSAYFMPLLKETPKDAEIVSHRLMLRTGMIDQHASGIYTWLPLGLRVLRKIMQIVREEQNRAGALELLMPTLQAADLWYESGRYEGYGKEMLRISDRHGREMLYGPTNEEMITDIFRRHIRSYKDLPLNLYHIQWKFRDEVRPRFGVMRGREFLMKDAYSFDIDPGAAYQAYYKMFVAYLRTFTRMGLQCLPVRAESGVIGGDMSHEFVILTKTGESEIYCDGGLLELAPPGVGAAETSPASVAELWTQLYAASDARHNPEEFSKIPKERQIVTRGIEVGHIFYFGTKYSEALKAMVTRADGTQGAVHMGSYGIGVSRLAGALIEAHHDEAGIIWPRSVAPFLVGIINLKQGDTAIDAVAEEIYIALTKAGVEVLYDDRPLRAGEKFVSMDLIGLPFQLLVGPKGLARGEIELRERGKGKEGETVLSIEAAQNKLIEIAHQLRKNCLE